MHIFKDPHFDFVRWRWHAIVISWIVILAGAAVIWTKGLEKGVEFSGGTIVVVKFDQEPDIERVRASLDKTIPGGGANAIVQRYGDPSSQQVMIRVGEVGAEQGGQLSNTADQVTSALRQSDLGTFQVVGREIVGPIVGEELRTRAVLATVLALTGILIYITLRFQMSFAVGAVVATVHDLLITLAFLAFFRYDMSLNVIAAILTITGYSMNDTIVIFDQVRENMRTMRRDNMTNIVNAAVNRMLDRTMLTGGTTLLSVIALYFFGGEVLKGFAFTMIVGVITGTYSSVFIAAAIVIIWQGRKPMKAVPAASATSPSPRRPSRRRAS